MLTSECYLRWQRRVAQCHQCEDTVVRELPEIMQLGPNSHRDSPKREAEAQESKGDKVTEVRFEDGGRGS